MHPRNNARIIRMFDANRTLSTRRAARQLHVSQSRVLRALRQDHWRAFHLQPVQGLLPGDAKKHQLL